MNYSIIDIETTGLNLYKGDRIIEISIIKLDKYGFYIDSIHFYLNPNYYISYGAYIIHGLSNKFLLNKPSFIDIYNSLVQFIGNSILVAHNAIFDISFIKMECSIINKCFNYIIIDTLIISRKLSNSFYKSLRSLCIYYKINISTTIHSALYDTKLLSKIFFLFKYNKLLL